MTLSACAWKRWPVRLGVAGVLVLTSLLCPAARADDKLPVLADLHRQRLADQIAWRYRDPAFQRFCWQLSLEAALTLYLETVLTVQTHYVDEVELGRLLAAGSERLETALLSPVFQQVAFAVPPTAELLARCRAILQARGLAQVRSLREAQHKLQSLALVLHQEAALHPAAVLLEFALAVPDALDEHCAFLTPAQLALERLAYDPNLAGIGAQLGWDEGALVVLAVTPGGPADRAGLGVHDRILRIEKADVRLLGYEEAVLALHGPQDSRVRLEVADASGLRTVEVPRRRLPSESVTARWLDADRGVGYVHLAGFHPGTAAELEAALDRLADRLRLLVLDLRGNPGGSLEAAVQVAERFLPPGLLLATRGRGPGTSAHYYTRDPDALSVPLLVLVDADTASAAEILAAALRDRLQARLAGSPTAGKGTVQCLFPLRTAGCGLRLTVARCWSASLQPLDGQPLVP
jgi:carboxyl-terminal processing protease